MKTKSMYAALVLAALVLLQACAQSGFPVTTKSASGGHGGTNPGDGNGGGTGTAPGGAATDCPSSPTGATYYVSTSGNDSADGTSAQPFKTIAKGLASASAGDRVLVSAGAYQEVVNFPKSGTSAKPIILQASGAVTIDAGDRVTGWMPAPEVGAGVYKNTSFREAPGNMTWNGKYVVMIEPSQKSQSEAFTILNQGPEGWDTYEGKPYRSWDGVEAIFGTYGATTYLRFAGNNNPNNESLAFAPKGRGVVNIDGKSHITVCGLTLQNGAEGVRISNNASNVIIHGNLIIGGHEGVEIDSGAHDNVIDGNELTLNYVHTLDPNDSRHWFIWAVFKLTSDWDRVAIDLGGAGNNNVISNNHIYQHWDGVEDYADDNPAAFAQNLKVFGNHIEHCADDGLEPNGGEVNAEWHDNLVHDCNIDFRIKSPTTGPLYIYRNRLMSPGTNNAHSENVDFYTYTGTTTPIYIYHNSISGYLANYFGDNASIGAPNTWWINNIISARVFGDFTGGGPVPHFDYNWAGGDVSQQGFMGPHNILTLETRMWNDGDLNLLPSSAVMAKGLDLSKSWTMDGVTHPPLPGMTPGYYGGPAPNLGYKP